MPKFFPALALISHMTRKLVLLSLDAFVTLAPILLYTKLKCNRYQDIEIIFEAKITLLFLLFLNAVRQKSVHLVNLTSFHALQQFETLVLFPVFQQATIFQL